MSKLQTNAEQRQKRTKKSPKAHYRTLSYLISVLLCALYAHAFCKLIELIHKKTHNKKVNTAHTHGLILIYTHVEPINRHNIKC